MIPAAPGYYVEVTDEREHFRHTVVAWADDGTPMLLANDSGLLPASEWGGWSVWGPDSRRPEIVVLCGSTRFYDAFQQANYDLTMAGKIVLSVGFYPHSSVEHGHGEGVGHDSAEKIALDELHKRKIDLADRVIVLNVGGYIGDSTRSEIAYATELGRPIEYLEDQTEEGSAA